MAGDESVGASPGEELGPLVIRALEDRALRQQAYTSGLDENRLLDHLVEESLPLHLAGLEERAAIELAEESLDAAEERREKQRRRIGLSRVLAVVVALQLLVLVGLFLFLLASEELWVELALASVGAIGVGAIGVALLLDWPPSMLAFRVHLAESRVRQAEQGVAEARARLAEVLVETEIKPALRTYLNSRGSDEYRTTLTLVEPEGLAELEDPRYAIPTRARLVLERFLEDMPGGSIGLSGPRGVGKTTLIRAVCPTVEGGTNDRFGVVVAAPVKFDSREFLLHLFAEVCRTVIGSTAVARLREPDPVSRVLSQPGRELLVPLAILAMPVVGVALVLDNFVSWEPLAEIALGAALVVGGAAAAWLHSSTRRLRLALRSRLGGPFGNHLLNWPELGSSLEADATKHLEDIWYQQTFTTGWSGSLKAGIAEGGLEGGRELARSQMTLPDIVADFRRLLARIAESRRVLIGIDELDKLESRKDAHAFMNEMKVLFGLDNCFFLISVSEDAMSAFERRGLPFRDVFDSSFDDVVNVSFLDVDESVRLVQERVVGMPLPFIYLCHCVAGGLARDVIRVAREVITANPVGGEGWPLHEACRKVVEADVRAKVAANLIATRRMAPGASVEELRSWLQHLQATPLGLEKLFEISQREGPDLISHLGAGEATGTAPSDSPRSLAVELTTFLLFAATLIEFFDEGKNSADYREARESVQIERLALARQAMAVHPQTAWESLREFREDRPTARFPIAVG